MSVQEQKRLLLQRKAIEELKERIQADSYLKVKDVMERLGISREKLANIPPEILPFVDLGTGKNHQLRYHPADVLAADARMRRWKEAQERGRGEAYLTELREQLEARDEAALAVAWEVTTAA